MVFAVPAGKKDRARAAGAFQMQRFRCLPGARMQVDIEDRPAPRRFTGRQ
jgi:hypothetical protein